MDGAIEIAASRSASDRCMVTLSVTNETAMPTDEAELADSRAAAVLRTLASTHAIVCAVEDDSFRGWIPPEEVRELDEHCRSDGWWPVLVGSPEEHDTMLYSPIILYDHPQIAPESPGDFFDATEIDEMLALRVLTLTEDERRQIAAFDERGEALPARTHAMAERQMADLHGARCSLARNGRSRR